MSIEVRAPAYQVLADELRAQITSGQLRPGDRLPTEPQLSADSGVSRSTVREALRLLASQNLIVTTRGVTGGSFVAHPSAAQLAEVLDTGVGLLLTSSAVRARDLLEVRAMLEVPAAGLAAQRRTEEHLAALREHLFDPDIHSPSHIRTAHRAFHVALAEATGNQLYELVTRPLYNVTNEEEILAGVGIEFWTRVDAEHRQILAAVEAGDGPAAEVAVRDHLAYLRRTVTGDD